MRYAKITASIGLRFKKDAKVVMFKFSEDEQLPHIKIGKDYYQAEVTLMKYQGKVDGTHDQWEGIDLSDVTHDDTPLIDIKPFTMTEITNPKDIAKLQPYKPTRKKRS